MLPEEDRSTIGNVRKFDEVCTWFITCVLRDRHTPSLIRILHNTLLLMVCYHYILKLLHSTLKIR